MPSIHLSDLNLPATWSCPIPPRPHDSNSVSQLLQFLIVLLKEILHKLTGLRICHSKTSGVLALMGNTENLLV